MIIYLFGPWALCLVYKGRTKRWAFDGSHEWKWFVLVMSFPCGWALAWSWRNTLAPFYPLSNVVSLAHAHCWTLCDLLGLTNMDLIADPVHSELRGATWAGQKWSRQGEWYSSEFCFQVPVELCALETGKSRVCGIRWKAAAVHCLQGGSHKREHCRPLEQGLDFSVTCQVFLLLRALS